MNLQYDKNNLIFEKMFRNFNLFFLFFKELNIFFIKEEKKKENININMFKMLYGNIDDFSSNIILIGNQNKIKNEFLFLEHRSYDLNLWNIFYKYKYNLMLSGSLEDLIEDISSYNKIFFYLKRYKKTIVNFNESNKSKWEFEFSLGSTFKSFYFSFIKWNNINFLVNKKNNFIFAFYYFKNSNLIKNILKNKYGFDFVLFFKDKFVFYFQEFFGKIIKNFVIKPKIKKMLSTNDLKIFFNNSEIKNKNTMNIYYYTQENLYLFNDSSLSKVQKMYNYKDENLNLDSFNLWFYSLTYKKINKNFLLNFSIWNFLYSFLFLKTLKKNKNIWFLENKLKKNFSENIYLSKYLNNINRAYSNRKNSVALKEYFLFNSFKNNKNFI